MCAGQSLVDPARDGRTPTARGGRSSAPTTPSCSTAHSPAAFRFGDPVTRGPYTSVKKCSVRMICECAFASCRIAAVTSASWDWRAETGASSPITADAATKRLSIIPYPVTREPCEPRTREVRHLLARSRLIS